MVLSNVNSEFNGLIISAFLSFIDVSRVDVSKVVFVFMRLYDFALFKRAALFSRCFKSCFVNPVMQLSLLTFPYFKLSLLIVIQLIRKDKRPRRITNLHAAPISKSNIVFCSKFSYLYNVWSG